MLIRDRDGMVDWLMLSQQAGQSVCVPRIERLPWAPGVGAQHLANPALGVPNTLPKV
jgi:hypothetical protein